jgi:hypothetical protein
MASAPTIVPHAPASTRRAGLQDRLKTSSWLPIALIVGAATLVYSVIALRASVPLMWPDEFRYAHLARSLADGHGFDWRGEHIDLTAALYVYALTPIWAVFHSTVDAYNASKVLGVLALCAQAIPVFAISRRFVGPRLALLPAALALAGTWMLTSAELATEALAMPLCTTTLCFAAVVTATPSRRAGFLALGLAALAAWARIQLVVLFPVLVVALALDCLRHGGGWRQRMQAHRVYFGAAAVISVVMLVAALAKPSLAGDYSGVITGRVDLSRIASKTGLELLDLVAVSGLLPLTLGVAVATSRRAWTDPQVGPLLCVFVAASLGVALAAGMFLAVYTPAWWGIERYVAYAVPIALVLIFSAATRPGLMTTRTVSIAAGISLLLLLHPGRVALSEERGAWSIGYRLHQALGVSTGVALALTAVVAAGAVLLVLRRPGVSRTQLGVAIAGVTAVVMLVQSQASWHVLTSYSRTFRASLPNELTWIDAHAGGPVAMLGVTQTAPGFEQLDFFNRDVTQAYGPASGLRGRGVEGVLCAWGAQDDGRLVFQHGCGATPHAFLINDPSARMTFHDETSSAGDPMVGRVVRVADSTPPRLQSLLVLPCPRLSPTFSATSPKITPADAPFKCSTGWAGKLWLDAPAMLVAQYLGGNTARTVVIGRRTWQLPPHRLTTVRIPLSSGTSQFTAQHDWTLNVGNPRLTGVELETPTGSQSLL